MSCASQLSCNDWISNASKSFCSGVSFSIHFALSKIGAGAAAIAGGAALEAMAVVVVEAVDFCKPSSTAVSGEEETVETVVEAAPAGLAGPAGEEKKDVMEALALGFLAVEVARSAALRLSGVVMMECQSCSSVNRQKKWWPKRGG